MSRQEDAIWLDMADRMMWRLQALLVALEQGANCRDPGFAVETAEVRAVDLLGLGLLKVKHSAAAHTVATVWHIHEVNECSSIQSSIARLQANRALFLAVVNGAAPSGRE